MGDIKIYGLSDKNGDVRYIGKTGRKLNLRLKEHITENKKNYKNNWIRGVNNDIDIFLIDEVASEDSNYWEIFYISLLKSWGFNLTNLTDGGDGGKNFKHSEETKKIISNFSKGVIFSEERKLKISLSKLGKKCPKCANKKGYKHSEETKKKIGEKSKGRTWKMSEESKKKLSTLNKGKKINEDVKKKISETLKGRKIPKETIQKSRNNRKIKALERGFFHSEKTKIKIKNSNLGHIVTKETRNKISKSCTKYNIETYNSIIELIRLNMNNHLISEKLNIPYHSIRYIVKKFKK